MGEKVYKMPIWQDYEEKFILKKEDVLEYLQLSLKEVEKTGAYENEDLDYFRTQNGLILNQIKRIKDKLIGLYVHPMNGWYVLKQDLVKDYINGKVY